MTHSHSVHTTAFTLIELLLAMTLVSAITVVAYTSFTTATRAWRVGTATADSLQHADYIMEQISMGLRSAYYPDAAMPAPAYGMVLTDNGDGAEARDTLSWVKLGSALVGEDSPVADTPHRTTLYVVNPGESEYEDLSEGGLVLKAWRLSALPEDFDPDDDTFVHPKLVMPGIVGLNFAVLNPENNLEQGEAPKPDDELEWLGEKWEGNLTNRLPYAVEVSIYLAPAEEREKPVEVKRVVTLPTAPLSWRDHGAAGGVTKTGRGAGKNAVNYPSKK